MASRDAGVSSVNLVLRNSFVFVIKSANFSQLRLTMQFKILCFIFSLFLTFSSLAETYTKTFPSLQGRYDFSPESKIVSFDFGVQFSSIQSATIEVSSFGVNAGAESCVYPISTTLYPTYDPPNCSFFQLEPQVFYEFELSPESYIWGTLAVNTETTDYVAERELLSETDELLDGKGKLFINHKAFNLRETGAYLVSEPYFIISEITLTIEGASVEKTSKNDCIASYNLNGLLNLPCVVVLNASSDTKAFKVAMKLDPSSTPLSFVATDIQQKAEVPVDDCNAVYNAGGSLTIPCVSLPDQSGIIMYKADMKIIPFSSPLSFELIKAQRKE